MSRPIRIVHCIGSLRLGGAEKQLTELMLRLPADRFHQSVVLLKAGSAGGGPLAQRLRDAGREVIDLAFPERFAKCNPLHYLRVAMACVRMVGHLRRRRPDVLHAWLFHANVLGAVAGGLAGVPRRVTSRRQLSRFKRGRRLFTWFESASNRFVHRVLVNSEAVRRDTIAYERLDPERIERIYNGVMLEDFDAAAARGLPNGAADGADGAALTVIAVANLHPYKGHEELLRAAARLAPRFPNLRLHLPGRDAGMGERLRELAGELRLTDRVEFLGERRDVPALLSAADVFVHPSHEEGFSNSILEAMAAGLPCIVTNVGGNPEQVTDGREGCVIPPRDVDALTEALGKLLDDRERRLVMGAAARARIEAEFNFTRTVADYAAFYERLVGRGPNPPD